MQLKSICVYCGSSSGNHEIYTETAAELGKTLATQGITLIYGGGRVGLMGVTATNVMAYGGQVTGIIPTFLNDKEGIAFDAITTVTVVDSMHERKALMYDLADAFIAMPGGYGTLDELFETLTWGQLGIHAKPIGLLNINGYYDFLIQHADKMVEERFLSPQNRAMLLADATIDGLLQKMTAYEVPNTEKWLENVVL